MHIPKKDNSFFEIDSDYVTIIDKDDWQFVLHLSKSENDNYNLTGLSDFYEYNKFKVNDSVNLIPNDIKNGVFFLEDKNTTDKNTVNEIASNNNSEQISDTAYVQTIGDSNSLTEIKKRISKVYSELLNNYKKIFVDSKYLPTKKTSSSILINGFTERNLTFHFCHQYLAQSENSLVWQEVPIWKENRQHIDSIIIDNDLKTVYYIEAKRFYGINHFEKLLDDLKRLVKENDNIPLPCNSNSNRLYYKRIIVLLADVFYHDTESLYYKDKKNCYDKFFNGEEIDSNDRYKGIKEQTEQIRFDRIAMDSIESLTIPKSENPYNCKPCELKLENDITYNIYCGAWQIK